MISINSTCFGQWFLPSSGALDCVYSLWYNEASSVYYTTSCKHSVVLLRMGEIIARNMLSGLKSLINRYCCIWLVVYIIVSVMHGHATIKATVSFVTSVCPSVRPSAWNGSAPTPNGFSLNLIFWVFFENLSRKFKFHGALTKITGTSHED